MQVTELLEHCKNGVFVLLIFINKVFSFYTNNCCKNVCMYEFLKINSIYSYKHTTNSKISFPIKQLRIILIILFIFISCSFTAAQIYPDPKVDSLLSSGIENIIKQEYDYAKRDFVILEKKYPEIPLGKIYLAAVEIAKSSDLALPYNLNFIYQKLDEAKDQAEDLLRQNDNEIWNYYFLALANGYRSYFNALNGDWISAFGEGITSVNIFEHCLEIDPLFYESYIAIGTYKYWKSKETRFIPFIKDERKEGIKYLEKAVKHSSYNSYLAVNSLIWIHIDKNEPEKAIELANLILADFPGCRFFRFGLARAYEDIDLKKAIAEYYKILNSYTENEKPNRCNEIIIMHLIAQQYNKLGEHSKSLELCREILNIENLTRF
jgi:hypothetical protein